jgi:hypothetical protein
MVKYLKTLLRAEEVGMSKNVETIGLGDLRPDPQNARKHTRRNVGMITDGLQEIGAARSIVIDEKGVVLAGNATIKAAGLAGLSHVKVVDADGSEIITVRRTNLTERQKKHSPSTTTGWWDVCWYTRAERLLMGTEGWPLIWIT